MKQKALQWFLAAILIVCGAMTTLTSCSDDDDKVVNPLGDKIIGIFHQAYDTEGTLSADLIDNSDMPRDYTRVVETYEFREDGMGVWNRYFLDDENGEPYADLGGGSGGLGAFSYTTTADGTINVQLYNIGQASSLDVYMPLSRQLKFVDGTISASGISGETLTLCKASNTWAGIFEGWHEQLHGGVAGDIYEANKDFNIPGQWRAEEYIYIYTGKGTDTDDRGKAGYEIIPLPWNSGASEWNGPQNFFDDMTPENGWELVLDLCGCPNFRNYNYFGLYNKYTGTLRIFTYIDTNLNVSDGNDVLFELTMGEQTSHLMSMNYGLPTSIANWKDKTKLGQPASGGHIFATPWVANRSTDGFVTPAPGWWAYDVDLSMYRPEAASKFKEEKMSLNMRVWHKDHVSLMGSINANIDGNIKGEIKQETITTAGNDVAGFFAKLDEFTEGEGLFSKFKSYYNALKEGDPMGSFKAGVDVLKYACKLSGSLQEGTTETFERMTGQLNFTMKGTINTSGYIQGSRAVTGMVNPTISNSLFFSNSTVGQGVWNLKKNPEIVRTNYGFDLNHYTDADGRNPFFELDDFNNLYNANSAPRFGWITYFDPTSIEVELNPNVFPEEDIEWMQVDAIPIVRDCNAMRGTDLYREQLGLNSRSTPTLNADRQKTTKDRKANGYTFHFFDKIQSQIGFTKYQNMPKTSLDTSDTETWGLLNWPSEWKGNDKIADNRMGCVGDINSDRTVAIDPQSVGQTYNEPGYDAGEKYFGNAELAAYEIMVTVTVKLKDRQNPIVLSRMYLPNFKTVDISTTDKVENEWTRLVEKVNADDMRYFNKQVGHMKVLSHELKRIYYILYDIDSDGVKDYNIDWLDNEL